MKTTKPLSPYIIAALVLLSFVGEGCTSVSHKTEPIISHRCSGAMKGGKREGPWTCYFKDGSKNIEMNYVDGRKHGQMILWYQGGEVDTKSHWQDGTLSGPFESYFRNGQIHIRTHYNLRGQFDGLLEEWDEQGQKVFEAHYFHGKQVDLERQWYTNGQLRSEYNYKDDQLHGPATEWYPTGQKKLKGGYENGQKAGTWTCWKADGKANKIDYDGVSQASPLPCSE